MSHPDPDPTPVTQRKHHWDAVYAAKPSTEVSWYQAVPSVSLDLIRASSLSPAAKIIDVGGGASTLADHLLSEGFSAITVLDLAAAALDQSRHRLGPAAKSIDWIAADILSWQPTSHYHLWHDRAVFHFLTDPAHRAAYLDTLKRALYPGATVILATFALNGPERCSGLPVRRYSPETLAAELGPQFTLVQTATEDHHTPSGALQSFVYCRFTHK